MVSFTFSRTSSREIPSEVRALAARPFSSRMTPRRRCSVPMKLWLRARASSWDRTRTRRARSVKRSNTTKGYAPGGRAGARPMSPGPTGGRTFRSRERGAMPMSLPEIVAPQEWRAARIQLLAAEKAMTRARDALSTKRRLLPMVRVEKDYLFEGPSGRASLTDLFEGRTQLIVQHFMFDPSWDDGCPSCTAASDEISAGLLEHLWARDTTLAVVSRAPLAKIERYKAKRGWTFPWYSSFGSPFNYDYHVTIDASVAPVMFNYRTLDELRAKGMGWLGEGSSEQPGYSMF